MPIITKEQIEIARQVLKDGTKKDLPASTSVFLVAWAPGILDTLEALWRVAQVAKKYLDADFEQPAKQQLLDALAALRAPGGGKEISS